MYAQCTKVALRKKRPILRGKPGGKSWVLRILKYFQLNLLLKYKWYGGPSWLPTLRLRVSFLSLENIGLI